MPLLIDGYNLLNVTGITGRRGDLHGSREALLRFLASAIEPNERPHTTIVFDAAEAPPGLPRVVALDEMTIRYAAEFATADELIEVLIAEDNSPRSLLVVSSDHRVQRAARRRRAQFVDSDVWFADAVRRRERLRRPAAAPRLAKPVGPLSTDEISYWVAEFAGTAEQLALQAAPEKTPADLPEPTAAAAPDDLRNPFPPGYAEDLLEGGDL
ncbi:MAG: NYN domain-containing protein [Pirellulales bacterium]|nr:NYN domain-containing protein [Pirellulales bacterium]